VGLNSPGTPATSGPTVLTPDHEWVLSSRWNDIWQEKRKYLEKTCPTATTSSTNPTRPHVGSNPGRRSGKPAAMARPKVALRFVLTFRAVTVYIMVFVVVKPCSLGTSVPKEEAAFSSRMVVSIYKTYTVHNPGDQNLFCCCYCWLFYDAVSNLGPTAPNDRMTGK
jgi:hypothetical protein